MPDGGGYASRCSDGRRFAEVVRHRSRTLRGQSRPVRRLSGHDEELGASGLAAGLLRDVAEACSGIIVGSRRYNRGFDVQSRCDWHQRHRPLHSLLRRVFAAMDGKPGRMDASDRPIYAHRGGRLLLTALIDGGAAASANGGTIDFAMNSAEEAAAWHKADVENAGASVEAPPGIREGQLAAFSLPIFAIRMATSSALSIGSLHRPAGLGSKGVSGALERCPARGRHHAIVNRRGHELPGDLLRPLDA